MGGGGDRGLAVPASKEGPFRGVRSPGDGEAVSSQGITKCGPRAERRLSDAGAWGRGAGSGEGRLAMQALAPSVCGRK